MFKKIIDEENYFNLSPQRIIEMANEGYEYEDMLVQCAFEAIRDSGIDWHVMTTYNHTFNSESFTCAGCDIMYYIDCPCERERPVTYYNEEKNIWMFVYKYDEYVMTIEPANDDVWDEIYNQLWDMED